MTFLIQVQRLLLSVVSYCVLVKEQNKYSFLLVTTVVGTFLQNRYAQKQILSN